LLRIGAEHSGDAHLFRAVAIQHEACHSLKTALHQASRNKSRQECFAIAACATHCAIRMRKSKQDEFWNERSDFLPSAGLAAPG
jgi:hypothetical protein